MKVNYWVSIRCSEAIIDEMQKRDLILARRKREFDKAVDRTLQYLLDSVNIRC